MPLSHIDRIFFHANSLDGDAVSRITDGGKCMPSVNL